MTNFDGPPIEEMHTSDESESRRTFLDGVQAAKDMINGILLSHEVEIMVELETAPVQPTEESIQQEKEKLALRAGQLSLAQEIKRGMEILLAEAQLLEE